MRDQLYEEQVRDDYKELLTLSLVFLGAPEANSVHINSPGAYHRARWITKVKYCLKVYLLGQQFNFLSTSLKLSENLTYLWSNYTSNIHLSLVCVPYRSHYLPH